MKSMTQFTQIYTKRQTRNRSLSSIGWRRGPGRGGAFVQTALVCPSPRTRSHSSPFPLLSIRWRGEGGRRPGEEWFEGSMRERFGEFSPRPSPPFHGGEGV